MKKQITLFVLVILTLSAQAQKKTFADQYAKIRQSTEGLQLTKFSSEEIMEKIAQLGTTKLSEDNWEKYRKMKDLLANAKQVTVGIETDNKRMPSSSQINHLLKAYDELVTTQLGNIHVRISGNMKRDKVKELVITVMMADQYYMFTNISFKKPIVLESYLGSPEEMMQLIDIKNNKR